MATYTEMVKKIRDWSNRDTEALPNAVIRDAIVFAADEAYRLLKVPALEAIYTYELSSGDSEILIPSNLTEIIQLRHKDSNSLTDYIVYGAKADVRSFYNELTYKYDYYFYTREQNRIIFYPPVKGDSDDKTTMELYYYGRQPAAAARYIVDTDSEETTDYQYYGTSRQAVIDSDGDYDSAVDTITNIGNHYWLGKRAPNWLRDENIRILLFGALAECFDYLMEAQESQVFRAKFLAEITALNNEDKMRMSRGGSVQTHYIAPLI